MFCYNTCKGILGNSEFLSIFTPSNFPYKMACTWGDSLACVTLQPEGGFGSNYRNPKLELSSVPRSAGVFLSACQESFESIYIHCRSIDNKYGIITLIRNRKRNRKWSTVKGELGEGVVEVLFWMWEYIVYSLYEISPFLSLAELTGLGEGDENCVHCIYIYQIFCERNVWGLSCYAETIYYENDLHMKW